MATIDQIIEWAQKKLPDWQGDAVRRILAQDELELQDKADILAMLKERHGLGNPQHLASKPIPLAKGQISGAPQDKVGIVLKALNAVKNVNAIPTDSYILFGHKGLSIIYGENGAGKSGYGRVLKRACSARDSMELIHPNIFEDQATGAASAVFKISVDSKGDQDISWTDGGPKNDLLANIVVFDSKGARVIVDEENDITFLPYGTHVFDRLITLFKELRATLEAERPLVAKLDYKEIPAQTSSGKFLPSISAITPPADIDAAVAWTEEQTQRLSSLKAKVSEAESPDRNGKIRRLRTIVSLTGTLQAEITKIETVLSDASVQTLRTAIENAVTMSKALEVAAQQSSGNEPLPGVGSPIWQAFYLAAKDYSVQEAYPARSFPVIGKDSLCVLCMQPLSSETETRFTRFHEFMEKEIKKKSTQADTTLKGILEIIRSLDFEKFAPTADLAQEIQERNAELAQNINAYLATMKGRADQMLQGGTLRALSTLPTTISSPAGQLAKAATAINRELTELEKGFTTAELQAFKTEVQELEARRALGSHKEDISQHVALLQKIKSYNEAIAATNIIAISAQGKKIISESITPELQKALQNELTKLGAGHLPLDTKPTRSDGEVVHKLTLRNGKLPKKIPLTAILSEGEQRVVAIAGFLAELAVAGMACPIVLDDPVSSLDHKFQGKIARRLAEIAQNRQVIIFTHDIGFLIELEDCAAELGTELATQTIRRKGKTPGYSAQGNPWHAMKVTERTELLLRKKLPQFEALHDKDMAQYNPAAAELYGMLRETWEALVEEELFNKVIRRHSSEIKTQSLRDVEVSTSDYKTIHFAMKKCSEWMTGHDKSKALDADRPDPKEIRQDIDAVIKFRGSFSARRKTIGEDRSKAIKAPPAVVG